MRADRASPASASRHRLDAAASRSPRAATIARSLGGAMSHGICPRLWQVEAARDGRLANSDLSNALRHRAECSECAQAARALSELGLRLKALPVQPTEPLVKRRTRQA